MVSQFHTKSICDHSNFCISDLGNLKTTIRKTKSGFVYVDKSSAPGLYLIKFFERLSSGDLKVFI